MITFDFVTQQSTQSKMDNKTQPFPSFIEQLCFFTVSAIITLPMLFQRLGSPTYCPFPQHIRIKLLVALTAGLQVTRVFLSSSVETFWQQMGKLFWEKPVSVAQRPSRMKAAPVVSTPGADYASNKEGKLGVLFLNLEWKQIEFVVLGIIYQRYLNYVLQDNNVNADGNQPPFGKGNIVI